MFTPAAAARPCVCAHGNDEKIMHTITGRCTNAGGDRGSSLVPQSRIAAVCANALLLLVCPYTACN